MRRGLGVLRSKLIDGRALAQGLRREMKEDLTRLCEDNRGVRPPCLAMVVVGDRPDSLSYVRMKNAACTDLGITSESIHLPAVTSQPELLSVVQSLNSNDEVDGILVQFPLPGQIDTITVIENISPDKDVDGLHPSNFGRLFMKGNEPLFTPCTPLGCMELLKISGCPYHGKKAVIIGRSNIVGMPMSALLQKADMTVSICHSKTERLVDYTQAADVVISAVGRPKIWTKGYFKPGSLIIDVGINVIADPDSLTSKRIVGDVDFEDCAQVADWITPVPGGVGPMTITMLLRNTIKSWKRRLRL